MKSDKKKTILIVDDTKPIRIMLLKKLEKNYQCLLSDNPRDALELFREYKDEISLIISDYEMPQMNGFEFLKRINLFKKPVPIIMVSGSLNKIRFHELHNLGVRKFIAKPVNLNRLLKEIKGVIEEESNSK
ncbi:response regulator [candidate division KSB1 bacterium]